MSVVGHALGGTDGVVIFLLAGAFCIAAGVNWVDEKRIARKRRKERERNDRKP